MCLAIRSAPPPHAYREDDTILEYATHYWTAEQAEAFTRILLGESEQHGVIFYDDALRITGISHGTHFITGWTVEELLGQSFATLFVPEDRERKLHEHEANTARLTGIAEDERWHMRKDGSRFWSSGVSLRRVEGGYVKLFRDATHLRARMKYLENVLQECNVRQDEKNVFIGTIAHELRNPLSPLKTAVELIKRLPDPNPRLAHPLGVMERQVGALERLVEDLVDLVRVQSGKMRIAYETIVLQDFLCEVIDNCRPAAQAKGIAIHHVTPSVPIEVEADPLRLQQVMLNLVNNAIKYTQSGGTIWLNATTDQTHFLYFVRDNGQGIGADLLPRIFDVFTQADGAQGERGAGLGIGLAVVKEIVALHQGTIEVRSEGPGKGSEFMVRIPQRRPHGSAPEPLPAPHAPH